MAHDQKLVEAVARAIHETEELWTPEQTSEDIARAALDAIDASGTHWVAPWTHNDLMEEVLFDIEDHWPALRDVILAERRGDAG